MGLKPGSPPESRATDRRALPMRSRRAGSTGNGFTGDDVVLDPQLKRHRGDGSIPTQLPPEDPVRKCGRQGWSHRRGGTAAICAVTMGMLVVSLSLLLSLSTSLPLSLSLPSRRFTSSRLGEVGCFPSLKAATSFFSSSLLSVSLAQAPEIYRVVIGRAVPRVFRQGAWRVGGAG